MKQKGIARPFLLVVVIFVAIGAIGYIVFQNAKLREGTNNVAVVPTTAEVSFSPSPTNIVTPTEPTGNIDSDFTFSVPENWNTYEYPDYEQLEIRQFPKNGSVAISNSDENCNFYIGYDSFGRSGPTNILDNKDVYFDGILFNERSWYQAEGELPFFSYYFTSDPKLSNITIYTWTPHQSCITDIESIFETLKFK